jgi:hypothetical protein
MSSILSNLSKLSNNSQLCVLTAENSLWSLVWLLFLNGLKCVFFAMVRPRLWPSLGLVLAITLSDTSFRRKGGEQRGMESSSPLAAVGVSRRELLHQTDSYL